MERTLYLIDDSIKQMIAVMNGQFPELWFLEEEKNDGCKTKIIIFGNGNKEYSGENLYSEEDEISFQQKMDSLLYKECRKLETEKLDRSFYAEKRDLIADSVNILFKKQTEESESPEENSKIEMYHKICAYWQRNIQEGEIPEEEKQRVGALINLMEISEGACVGIDMALLHHDIERTKEGKAIISMELYHQLKQKYKDKCFVFSNATFDEKFIEKWTETYRKIYSKNGEEEVYQKIEMKRKKHDAYVFEGIMKLLNES